MANRSRMTLIMGPIGLEQLELFALELGKIAEFDIVYTVASTNINQSVPNFVKMYVTIGSGMSSIMGLIRSEQSKLFALELDKMLYLTLFMFLIASANRHPIIIKLSQNIYHQKISDEFGFGSY